MPVWVPVLMVVLLGLSGFFSASETALFSLEPVEVRRRSSGTGLFAESLAWCHDRAPTVLLTILLTNLAINTFYFALAAWWAQESGGVGATAVTLGALMALVFCGEILPKTLALTLSGPYASLSAPVIRVWSYVLAPLRLPLAALLRVLGRRIAARPEVPRELSSTELERLVRKAPERFGLGKRAADVVGELVSLTEMQVREVMVPSVDLELVDADQLAGDVLAHMLERGWRWMLVRGEVGPVGFVDAKDLLVAGAATPVAEIVRPLAAIPELARLPNLLQLFREAKVDRALAVDEYGQEAGVAGRDDLTESVVGGLARSEHEAVEAAVRLRPHRGWEVLGSLGVREFEDLFSVRLPMHRNRTIGGLIVEQLGNLPQGGEQVRVGDLTFEVLGASRGRVRKLLVCFPHQEAGA